METGRVETRVLELLFQKSSSSATKGDDSVVPLGGAWLAS